MMRVWVCILVLAAGAAAYAGSDQIDDLKSEVEKIRKQLNKKEQADHKLSPASNVDEVLSQKYGPGAEVTTRTGKLQIGGLVQVWYQSIHNDRIGIAKATDNNNLGNDGLPNAEPNELLDNDTFRVRRTELRFGMDITENIFAYIMMDPTRESNIMFTPIPTFPNHNAIFNNPTLATGGGRQGGNSIIPSLLQDAFIEFHDVVPHHEFRIGQFKPPAGEEAARNSGQLEFVDRAMVTAINNVRDIGVQVHGTWFDNRLQYWVGLFNGPDGTVLTDPEIVEGGNRSDDNDDKDIAWRIAGRPVWDPQHWWGRLELGYARTDGYRGEAGNAFDPDKAINGLNKTHTAINRQAAWAWYRPGSKVKGWWFRGEWGSGRDRFSISARTNLMGTGSAFDANENVVGQTSPAPKTVSGWYFGTGYKMSDSIWAEGLKSGGAMKRFLCDLEFAFRYEVYQNIAAEDLVEPDRHTDLFKTEAYTAGVNYYLKGHDAKIQANYIFVDDPQSSKRGLREVKNDVFVVAFQVMW